MLYAVKLLLLLYWVLYEHVKRNVVGHVYVIVSSFLRYVADKIWQNWMISHFSYHKCKTDEVFF